MENQPTTPKQQVVERLRGAQSILVTVTQTPSVDEVAAAVGLSRLLAKFGKKVTTVISAPLPSVLDFLRPREVVSTSIDRLRDFVIELDKDKADKLRYKPEEDLVKIFITPYKTEISQKDLRFSRGDYNVDTIVVIGATNPESLDKVVLEHNRILHDAAVLTLSVGPKLPSVGTINWHEPEASSVAELLVSVADALQAGLLDKDSSQALLSAIVVATDGFRNEATTPKVMTIAAQLMAGGADQHAVMEHFQKGSSAPGAKGQPGPKSGPIIQAKEDQGLVIEHEPKPKAHGRRPEREKPSKHAAKDHPVAHPQPKPIERHAIPADTAPQSRDSSLAADAIDNLIKSAKEDNARLEAERASIERPAVNVPLMSHQPAAGAAPRPAEHVNTHPSAPILRPAIPAAPAPSPVPPPPPPAPVDRAQQQAEKQIDAARQAVEQAVAAHPEAVVRDPIQALNAQSLEQTPDVAIDHEGSALSSTHPPPIS